MFLLRQMIHIVTLAVAKILLEPLAVRDTNAARRVKMCQIASKGSIHLAIPLRTGYIFGRAEELSAARGLGHPPGLFHLERT